MKLAFKFDSGKVVTHEVFERTFTIGRSDKCRVSLDSEGFSREHCLIELVDGVIYITDLGSKNGVFINHVRIPAKLRISYDQKYPLYMGEAFLTIDISNDMKDVDHLSLQTYTKINPAELYRPLKPPVKPSRPRTEAPKKTEKTKKENPDFFSSGISLVIAIVLIAAIIIYLNRKSIHGPGQPTEQQR